MCVRHKRKYRKAIPAIDDKKCREKEHESCVMDVVNALSLGNGEFLIAIAWIDETAPHHYRLYPKILGFDVQFRKNSEERGLHRGCSVLADGRNLPNFVSFIPSSQAQVLFSIFTMTRY